jgi:cytochrome P450
MNRSFNAPENLDYWMQMIQPMAKERFTQWAERGEPISLFRGMSELVMSLLLYVFTGREFAERHVRELVPMMQSYEWAMQKPQTKALPRWMSRAGRLLDAVEERMKVLIDQEVLQRLKNPEKYEKNLDYLQMVLNTVGRKYIGGVTRIDHADVVYSLHILALMNGGHTNQTTTFVWSLLHAMQSSHLDVLREQTTDDLIKATIRETGRLYTNFMMLRRLTKPQVILGKHLPKGTFIACSPVVTARDPTLFSEPDKFRSERWLTETRELDEARIKNVHRSGASIHFGKGQHACLGEKLGTTMVMLYWSLILGQNDEAGFDVEFISGTKEGVGVDNIGVEPAWAEENLGTPFEKGNPVLVRFKQRTKET